MANLKIETNRVKILLAEIDANPEIFVGLEDKKITPALIAYQCVSTENLAHSINELNKTFGLILKRLNNKALKVLFQDVGKGI